MALGVMDWSKDINPVWAMRGDPDGTPGRSIFGIDIICVCLKNKTTLFLKSI